MLRNKDEKEQIDCLNKEAKRLSLQSPKQAIEQATKAEALSRKINDRAGLAESLLNIAAANWQLGHFHEVERYSIQALEIFETLGNKQKQLRALQGLGVAYRRKGLLDKALQVYQRALELARQLDDKQGIANCLNYVAGVYANLAEYDKAMQFLSESITTYQMINDAFGEASALSNFAILCSLTGNSEQAIMFYEKSITQFEKVNSKVNVARAILNLSGIFLSQKELDKAITYSQKAIELFEELGNNDSLAIAKYHIALALAEKKAFEESERVLKECLAIAKQTSNKMVEGNAWLSLGRLYVERAKMKLESGSNATTSNK